MIQIDTTILAANYKLFYILFALLIFLVILSIIGWIIVQTKKDKPSDAPIAFHKSISSLIMLRGIVWLALSYIIIKLSIVINLTFLMLFGIIIGVLLGLGELILSIGLFTKKPWAEWIFHKVKHFILAPVTDKKANELPTQTLINNQNPG
ncbi:hypothetical protein HYW75_01855 [Candidatus Pacearchaeota archaeon]|nr:hypothetical protein [Candidatus Pacearchaeota archaeon]